MTQLIPCPSCNRHVRQAETSCPFCSAELSLGHVPQHPLPRARLGRAATFAFGATIVGAAALTGCSSTDDGKTGSKGGSAGMSTGGSSAGQASGGTGITPVYGAPAAGTGDTGGTSSSGGSSAGGAGQGGTVSDGGGAMALYGAVPAGGSEGKAGAGGFPLYGAAPAD
ncbi:MAG TPA: hypothetical protein VNG33_14135 [Polyangiaceae bacterium]|nr:hypothetical protein [Polyangiaceae bacterium]